MHSTQMILLEINNSNNHNMIKNPNWEEGNQLAIYKYGQGSEFRTTENKSSKVARAKLKPRTARLPVGRADHLTILPPITTLPLDMYW